MKPLFLLCAFALMFSLARGTEPQISRIPNHQQAQPANWGISTLSKRSTLVKADDDEPVPIIQEISSKGWCLMPPNSETGPVIDEETFKKARSVECASFLKQLKVDFQKQSLIAYGVRGDCFVSGSIKITRNDKLKTYTLAVTKHYGGCRAAGSFHGWVVIEKLRPDYKVVTAQQTEREKY